MKHATGFIASEVGKSKDDTDSSSTSSDEDEEACELTEDVEKNFFRALSCLKNKDPQIYNKDARFFEKVPQIDENAVKEKRKKKTEKPFTLREYEKNMLENGELPNDEDEYYKVNSTGFPENKKKSYVEEQKELKQSFKQVLYSDSEANDSDNEIGGLFRKHSKSKSEKEKDEEDYRQWLKGQKNELDDKTAEGDMKFLHDYWNDPNLEQDEKYLRDYILNKRFLEKDNNDRGNPDKLVTLEEDEEILNNQLEFEHKYNFRFEEPDQEFIKRYPRIMENSMRKKDNKRKLKREAVKKRKQDEKEEKIKELKKLRASKHREIEEKIKKIKEATGNEELGFEDEDIEKDFDPNEHDLQMQKLFSEEFYNEEENKKPFFTEDLDLDQYEDYEDGFGDGNPGSNCVEVNYEDEDFNMDCDYSPEKAALAKKQKLEAREKKKNKKKLVSATESILLNENVKKPVFDKNLHKTFQNYLDEYYGLDCEDFIGDMPCRFKYRQVVPNSFGLTVEEILAADDKELNEWCKLNKVYEIRPTVVEMYDVKAYEKKARNEELKRKILPSLYKSDQNDVGDENEVASDNKKKRKKKKKKRKKKSEINSTDQGSPSEQREIKGCSEYKEDEDDEEDEDLREQKIKPDFSQGLEDIFNSSSSSNKQRKKITITNDMDISLKRSADSSVDSESRKKHKKDHDGEIIHKSKKVKIEENGNDLVSNIDLGTSINSNNSVKKKQRNNVNNRNLKLNNPASASKRLKHNERKFNKNTVKRKNDHEAFYNHISDSRLKAYGIKPKKFKNKLKYGIVN